MSEFFWTVLTLRDVVSCESSRLNLVFASVHLLLRGELLNPPRHAASDLQHHIAASAGHVYAVKKLTVKSQLFWDHWNRSKNRSIFTDRWWLLADLKGLKHLLSSFPSLRDMWLHWKSSIPKMSFICEESCEHIAKRNCWFLVLSQL